MKPWELINFLRVVCTVKREGQPDVHQEVQSDSKKKPLVFNEVKKKSIKKGKDREHLYMPKVRLKQKENIPKMQLF